MKSKPDFSKPLPKGFIKEYSKNSASGAVAKAFLSALGRNYYISTFTRRRKKYKPSQI